MLWIKALHIAFMVTWFAGLFYLPRLFVYHAMSNDSPSIERFKVMERKLFYGIMTPGAFFTVLLGIWLWFGYGFSGGWLHAKLVMVALLLAFHFSMRVLLKRMQADAAMPGSTALRWYNELPVLILLPILYFVVFKPF
jgi:putative membrane protein